MTEFSQRLLDALDRGKRFVTHDVWRIGGTGDEVPYGFVIRQVRVTILLVQNLVRDALTLRAAALTFATALGIVPFLALTFFVIQTFDVDTAVYEYLSDILEGQRTPPALAERPSTDPAHAILEGNARARLLERLFHIADRGAASK